MKTIKLSGKDVPFDDSNIAVEFVDVLIERAVIDGVLHIGFGRITSGVGDEGYEVDGVVRLRMPLLTAAKVAEILNGLLARASDQAAKLRDQLVKERTN